MQIMTDKGLVSRDESCRPQIYRPCDPQIKTQGQLLRHMLDRVFGGSTRAMVLQALSQKKTSPRDLKEIEKLLDRIEGEKQQGTKK
jgi:predicted transcriptional regulator